MNRAPFYRLIILHNPAEKITPKRRPQRRGRVKRNRKPTNTELPISQKRDIPSYSLLNENALSAIENQADWLMENVGVEFRSDEIALELFREAGATVKGESVKFEPGLLRQLCYAEIVGIGKKLISRHCCLLVIKG